MYVVPLAPRSREIMDLITVESSLFVGDQCSRILWDTLTQEYTPTRTMNNIIELSCIVMQKKKQLPTKVCHNEPPNS